MKRWYFTIVLMVAYAVIFHLWNLVQNPTFWMVSGILWAGLLVWGMVAVGRKGYFLNRTDAVIHGFVVLDIVLEAVLISRHSDMGFYRCAIGFALVILAYRYHVIRYRLPMEQERAAERETEAGDGDAG